MGLGEWEFGMKMKNEVSVQKDQLIGVQKTEQVF